MKAPKMLKRVIIRFRRWRERRRWPAAEQVRWVRMQLINDSRWLASDPKASAICERYLEMLSEDWQKVSVEDISSFRRRIGSDPHHLPLK